MFLHAGASLHGHEYSNHDRRSTSPQHANRRPTLLRSALASQKPRRRSTQSDGSRPGAPQPRRPTSEHIAFAPEEVVVRYRKQEEEPEEVEGEGEEEDEETEREDELATPMSADPGSLSGPDFDNISQSSEIASTRTSSRRRRRVPRKSTRYVLAYPAPSFAGRSVVVQKVIPKLYLQLQRVSAAKRPMPAIDVFSSSRIAGPVIAPRVAKRFPRIFGVKGGLGSDDVVLMKSEDYDEDRHGTESEEEEHSSMEDQRKLLAVFSPLKKSGLTEIVLDDGSVWVAQPLPTGSFDFVHVDVHGIATTARWVRRAVTHTPGATRSSGDGAPPATQSSSAAPEVKYTFSIINPLSRRHPVMATLTQSALDIQSQYTNVSTSSSRYPPTRSRSQTLPSAPARSRAQSLSDPLPTSSSGADGVSGTILPPEPESDRSTHPVDDATKKLISVTAVWLALRSGWSPYYKSSPPQSLDQNVSSTSSTIGSLPAGSPATTPARPGRRCTWSRRNSMEECSTSTPRSKELTDSALAGLPKCATGSSLLGTKTGLCSRDHSPTPSASTIPNIHHTLPRRATSTGAAFMKRHIQLHSPEASDTEHTTTAGQPDPGPRRKARSRILSGDWAPSLRRIGSGSSKGGGRPVPLQGRIPSIRLARHDHPASPASPLSPMSHLDQATITVRKRTDRERRVQSAFYTTRPILDDSEGVGDGEVVVSGGGHDSAFGTLGPSGELQGHHGAQNRIEGDARKGVAGKLRSFGNWFRRLGAH